MAKEVNNGMNTIDVRDIVERIAELKPARDAARVTGNIETAGTWTAEDGSVYADSYSEEEERELRILDNLAEECLIGCGARDLESSGRALIKNNFFPQYVQEFAEGCGDIARGSWLAQHVDWEAAAEAVKMDYKSIDFDGKEYQIRG